MNEKNFKPIAVRKQTAFDIDELRQMLVDEARSNGSINADKITLGDVVAVAVSETLQRKRLAKNGRNN